MMKRATALQAIILLLQLICFEVQSQSDGSTAPMEEKEKDALYSTIQGFVGKWWNVSGLYPDPCGWTPIQGVSCDLFDNGMWYVTTIIIGPIFDNSLKCSKQAEFSPYLFELRNLRSLSIIDCFSSQPVTIPFHNWNMLSSTLETMEFRSNKGLTGEIPPALGQLVNLKSLVLGENSLRGELPWELGNLVSLKRLTLSANQLSGQVPSSIGAKLAELLIMDISSNSLCGPMDSSLGGLTSLLKLDLSNNLLSGNLPPELLKLKNLTLLDLGNNNLTGGLDPSLAGMVSLEDLVLSKNPLGGSIKEFGWRSFKNLTHLDLSNMGLVGEIPDSITELKKLRFLALDNNHLTGFVTTKLAAMPSLTALYLNGNNFTGELGFPEEFYRRMGRRFASWRNPNLCYKIGAGNTTGKGPAGVDRCVNEGEGAVYGVDLENNLGSEGTTQGSESIGSFGFSAYSITRFLWPTFLEVVVIHFLLSLM
ncbi:hypothetical protein KFK09_005552 [Dendrobium nobile]|uniref:Disease resistance R13L4/SHOC-2-like LRR domain-containing protein n=1 Tax=Dendrobium nobile TaxID=94219 RepID=A0A8T3BVZ7_DENNO|nr:hypothetical protein KFK09_005552 [Dendrobium nobile]